VRSLPILTRPEAVISDPERDQFRINHHRASARCSSMIFSNNRFALCANAALRAGAGKPLAGDSPRTPFVRDRRDRMPQVWIRLPKKSRKSVCSGRLRTAHSRTTAQKRRDLCAQQANRSSFCRCCRGQCDSKANTRCYFVTATQLLVNFSFTNQRVDSFSWPGVNLEAKV